MDKKKTPVISIIFYIIGILFLLTAAFMLVSGVGYIKTYLASYGATFADMWSNSVQYMIGQFVPYLGIGIVCLGIGKAIKEATGAKTVQNEGISSEIEERMNSIAAAIDGMNHKVNYLSEDMDATRKVLSIKIEETEKRDAYRLREMGRGITEAMKALEVDAEPVRISVPVAAAETEPAVAARTEDAQQKDVQEQPAGAQRPGMFTMARKMAMPACVAPKSKPGIFTMARKMTMPACGNNMSKATEITQLCEIEPNQLADAVVTVNKEEKAMKKYPQIFTMARKMVMPPCGK